MLNQNYLQQVKVFLNLFKLNDKDAGDDMPDGQAEIAASILFKIRPRVVCLAPTCYGKSEVISMGAIYRAVFFKEDFVIGSVKYGTSDIIWKRLLTISLTIYSFFPSLSWRMSTSLSGCIGRAINRNLLLSGVAQLRLFPCMVRMRMSRKPSVSMVPISSWTIPTIDAF